MARIMPEPPLVSALPDIVSSRIHQKSATGANAQRIGRKGSHYRVDFVTHPLDADAARDWLDLRNEDDTVIVAVPQLKLDIGAPGLGAVDGGPQAGAALSVRGLTPNYAIRKGQLLNHTGSDGELRLYAARQEVITDADGAAEILLDTMLTWPALDGEVVDLRDPKIEGFATVDPSSWLMDGNGYQTLQFSVEEAG